MLKAVPSLLVVRVRLVEGPAWLAQSGVAVDAVVDLENALGASITLTLANSSFA